MASLHKCQAFPPKEGSVAMRITVPAVFYPLFQGLAAISEAPSLEAFAIWCILKGMVSEEVLDQFNAKVNAAL